MEPMPASLGNSIIRGMPFTRGRRRQRRHTYVRMSFEEGTLFNTISRVVAGL
ncbi:unnamed protein product [Ectocarpus sp. CCAP 1310/34]|nr:unnamed protein product [Ectocarpus sp. CCAP 1310/34]